MHWRGIGRNRTCPTLNASPGIERIRIARHSPVLHIPSYLVMPAYTVVGSFPELAEGQDAGLKRRVKMVAENIVTYRESRDRKRERVGHLKVSSDIRSLEAPDPHTECRDLLAGMRSVKVRGC